MLTTPNAITNRIGVSRFTRPSAPCSVPALTGHSRPHHHSCSQGNLTVLRLPLSSVWFLNSSLGFGSTRDMGDSCLDAHRSINILIFSKLRVRRCEPTELPPDQSPLGVSTQ